MVINEQIVARLGLAFGAPVADVSLIYVPNELVAMEPGMSHVRPGLAHGSRWLDYNVTDREWYKRIGGPENHLRHAMLAIMNGWLGANDRQVLYGVDEPNLVFSVDHGNFFEGGPNWSVNSLATAQRPQPDRDVISACSITDAEIRSAGAALASVPDRSIARAIAAVPVDCGLEHEERVALAEHIAARRDSLAQLIRDTY